MDTLGPPSFVGS